MNAAEVAGAAAGRWLADRMGRVPALRPLCRWIGLRNLEHRGLVRHQPDGSVLFSWNGEEHHLSASEWRAASAWRGDK